MKRLAHENIYGMSNVRGNRYQNKFTNNWELVCFLLDMNNSVMLISDESQMPNYLLL